MGRQRPVKGPLPGGPFRIERGVRVRLGENFYVVTAILPDLEFVMGKDLNTGRVTKLPVRDLRNPKGEDSPRTTIDVAGVDDAAWAEAERRRGLIEPLLQGRRTLADVQAQASAAGVHWATIYAWLRAYERTGQVSALLPTVRPGGRGESRLPPEVEAVIQAAIDEHYLNAQRPSATKTAQVARDRLRKAGLRVAGENTILRRIAAISEKEKVKRRLGRRAAEEEFGPKAGQYTEAAWNLAVVQIDHTQMDIVVVDDKYRLPIGRPWITLAIDVFSRMVVGIYVSLDPPGASSVGLCLTHAILPKETWLAERDVDGARWPVWGFFRVIHADNAREFRGEMLKRACKEYPMDLQWRPVKKPRYGAHIERLMGTVAEELHAQPGTTFSNPEEKGDYDSEGKAAFTLRELERWLATWITRDYHLRPHKGIGGMTPLQRWEAGVLGTDGFTATGVQSREFDEEKLRLDLMPFVERTIQDHGVEIDNVHYYDSVLRRYIDAREPGRARLKRKFRFRRDPREISVVYFYDPDSQRYYPIPYRDPSRPAMSVWTLRKATKLARERTQGKLQEQDIFDAHEELQRQTEAAVERTRQARKVRTSKALREVQRAVEHARAEKPLQNREAVPAQEDDPIQAPRRVVQPFEDIEELA